RPRVIVIVLACASIEFSTNLVIAFRGLLCDSAMMRIAFQSSPIRSLPLSVSFDRVDFVFEAFDFVTRISSDAALARSLRALRGSLHEWVNRTRVDGAHSPV